MNEPLQTIDNIQGDDLYFRHLPAVAKWVLENKLDEFGHLNLRVSKERKVPLLNLSASYSEKELLELGRPSNIQLLESIAQNNLRKYIDRSIKDWLANTLENVDRYDIKAEDIVLISQVRRIVFRILLKEYTQDLTLYTDIMDELDHFTTTFDMEAFNTYLGIHQEMIRKMNDELKAQKDELLEAQRLAKMGSFYWDITGSGKSVYTPMVYEIFELDKPDTLENFLSYVHEEDRQRVKNAVQNAIAKGEMYESEYRYKKYTGMKYVWSRGYIHYENGMPVAIKGTIMDITQESVLTESLKLKTAQLEVKNRQLELKNQELESFNYVASHDLQEPVRKILVFANRIFEDELEISPNAKAYIEKIIQSASRMQRLINDLLKFAQSTTISGEVETIELNKLIEEVKNNLALQIEDTGTIINYSGLPSVSMIYYQGQQLFSNLINNAIKYKKTGINPEIHISSETIDSSELINEAGTNNFIRITIADNGIGFDQRFSERMFDLFARVHNENEYSGTGIGLAICKKIVSNHKGYIKAESDGQSGSKFHIYLPDVLRT